MTLRARENVSVAPTTGATGFDRKHGARGTTKIYRDLVSVDIQIDVTPETRPLTEALTLAHERGHVGVLSDIVEGMPADEAADAVKAYDRWQNELEAWVRAARGWVLVTDRESVEFVLDCLSSYRRGIPVPDRDWRAMRPMLGDAIVDDAIRPYWDTYQPMEPDAGDPPPECGAPEPSDDETPEGWEPTPGDDDCDDPDCDQHDDGLEPDDDATRGDGGFDDDRGFIDWMEPDVIAEVLRGDPPVEVARRHGLDLADAPPLVVAHM